MMVMAMTKTNATPRRQASSEAGFALLEAIIAGFILLLVGVALSSSMVGTAKTQARVSLDERRMAVAEGVFERLKSETQWLRPDAANCQSMPMGQTEWSCRSAWLNTHFQASSVVNQSTSAQPIKYQTDIKVVAIDDAYDGIKQYDRDGTRPDYYTAHVSIRRDASEQWFTIEGTVDPPGRITTGALIVSVCRVTRQWDERIPIGGCPANKPDSPLGYSAGSPSSSDLDAAQDWEAMRNRAASGGNWDMVSFDMTSANVQVTIEQYPNADGSTSDAVTNSWGGSPGCSKFNGNRTVRCTLSTASSERLVTGLIPGRYRVTTGNLPGGYEVWPLHSIPSDNTALVEKGRRSRVLQVIKPVDRASYRVSLWSCDHSEVQSWGSGPCVNSIQPYGLSARLAPAPSSRAHWSNRGSAARGASFIEFTDLAPGLYSARMITGGYGTLPLHRGPAARGADLKFLWLNPVSDGVAGADDPDSGTASWTRHWCDYSRRVSYLSRFGLGPGGGTIYHTHSWTHTHWSGTTRTYHTHTYNESHYYYPATSCQSSGGGGGPPGPGGGGA